MPENAHKSNKHRNSAVQQEFHKFINDISEKVIPVYGTSYMFHPETRNKWRHEIAYSAEAEDFLVRSTRVFIRMMDDKSSNSKNPVFLKSLVNLMADYLSSYTMRAPNRTRNAAKQILMDALWNNNSYIQNMLARQAEAKQERKSRKPAAAAKKRKAQKAKQAKIQQAKKDYEIARDIRGEFAHVSAYRKQR